MMKLCDLYMFIVLPGNNRDDSQSSTNSDNFSNNSNNMSSGMPLFYTDKIDNEKCRYPHSIVWTPIPFLTWIFPFIGHMGICTTQGIIRDFAGPYFVSENSMQFGNPTKYWQLDMSKVPSNNANELWDRSVYDASEVYKGRMHNLCCDNCHSHVAYALNEMKYGGSDSWNMVKLAFLMLVCGKQIGCSGFLRQWLPFLILSLIIAIIVIMTKLL